MAYWWQALILIILFSFLLLIYKEIVQEHLAEPAAIFLVIEGTLEEKDRQLDQSQIIMLYQNEQIKFKDSKLFVRNGDIYFEQNSNIKKIMPGEVFDFAGVCLQLMRWDNARQFINQYRASTKSQ